MSSLPVPVSPRIRTTELVGATIFSVCQTDRRPGLERMRAEVDNAGAISVELVAMRHFKLSCIGHSPALMHSSIAATTALKALVAFAARRSCSAVNRRLNKHQLCHPPPSAL